MIHSFRRSLLLCTKGALSFHAPASPPDVRRGWAPPVSSNLSIWALPLVRALPQYFGAQGPLLLLCCCVGLLMLPLVAARAQDEAPTEKPGRSVLRGRVIFADSEEPLRRAIVRLRKEFNRDFLKRTLTGKRGEFSFQGVPAGTYYVDVQAPGVVSLLNGVSFTDLGYTADDSSLTLVTVDGTNDVKTEIRAVRGAVISGRISYADDEPATHAKLVLYRQKDQSSVLFFLENPLFTDDRGVYRIEGLPPGQYVVGAIENHSGNEKTFPDGGGLVTAFHPAAANVGAATAISVQAGSETRDVNIKLVEEPRQLSGTLKWKQNTVAIKEAIVYLRRVGDPQVNVDFPRFLNAVTLPNVRGDDSLAFRNFYFLTLLSSNSPFTSSDEKGHWTFPEVPPGTYIVSVEAQAPVDRSVKGTSNDLPESRGIIRGSAEVKIADKDVDNLVIELTSGASIVGSVVIEGNADSKSSVVVKTVSEGLHFLNMPVRLNDDRSFVLSSVPAGAVRLDISETDNTPNYYIRSMTGKGLNLLDEPLIVADGEQVTGVQIVLGTDLATVEGRVVAASGGGSVAGAGVVLLPVDQRKWNTRSLWGLARADAEGRFSLRLAPGEYVAFTWSLTNDPAEPIESYVRSHLSTTQRITLTRNATQTIEVQAPATKREP